MNFVSQSANNWWIILPVITIVFNLVGLVKAYQASVIRKNAFGEVPWLYLWGVFVNADALVISPFFIIVALISILWGSFNLFMLFFCVFWFVRGIGEMVYWLNQQFSAVIREKPVDVPVFGRFIKDKANWFLMQIFMQCVAVFALVGSVYFAAKWLVELAVS